MSSTDVSSTEPLITSDEMKLRTHTMDQPEESSLDTQSPNSNSKANTIADLEGITNLLSNYSDGESIYCEDGLQDTKQCRPPIETPITPFHPCETTRFSLESKQTKFVKSTPTFAPDLPPGIDQLARASSTAVESTSTQFALQFKIIRPITKVPRRRRNPPSTNVTCSTTTVPNGTSQESRAITKEFTTIQDKNPLRNAVQSNALPHSKSLDEKETVPRPEIKQPNWTTIPEKSAVPTLGFHTAIIPPQQALPGPVHSGNPYIQQSRLSDGQLSIILLHPSQTSAVSRNWAAYIAGTFHLSANKEEGIGSGKEQVGPYRSAAMWEFIGKTFQKADRQKFARPKKGRRYCCYAQGIGNVPGSSSLSREVLPAEEVEDFQVKDEWAKLLTGDEGSESTPVLSIESGLGLGLGIEWMYSDR